MRERLFNSSIWGGIHIIVVECVMKISSIYLFLFGNAEELLSSLIPQFSLV